MRPVTHTDEHGTVHRSDTIAWTPCGKRGYTSRKLAATVAASARRRTGDDIRHYRCDDCHCFHVGHRPWWAR